MMLNEHKNKKSRLSYKKSIGTFFCIIGLFVAFHIITWGLFTRKILSGNNNGDLARLAYLPQYKQAREFVDDLPGKHLELADFKGENVDVLTIGDSFSNGIGGGKNRFYQDYIVSKQKLNVVNAKPFNFNDSDPGNPFETLIFLLNSGVIDDIKPKIIVLESVERLACMRSDNIKLDAAKDKRELMDFYHKVKNKNFNNLPRQSIINNGNYKYYLNTYKKNHGANIINNVAVYKLNKKMFSIEEGNQLLFIADDIKVIPDNYTSCIDTLNDNLNLLAKILIEKNIKLYFMLVVDKSNLYSKYIDGCLNKRSQMFELLREKNKLYYFIDTKKILSEELDENGTLDLFYVDDTHWSWKASETIFTNVLLH